MNDQQRTLIQIAKLALEAVDLEVAPPPATEPDPPKSARKVRRQSTTAREPKSAPKFDASAIPASTGPGKGNYPRKKKYECVACHRRFESKESLLDVTCPECNSTNIIKQSQERQLS